MSIGRNAIIRRDIGYLREPNTSTGRAAGICGKIESAELPLKELDCGLQKGSNVLRQNREDSTAALFCQADSNKSSLQESPILISAEKQISTARHPRRTDVQRR